MQLSGRTAAVIFTNPSDLYFVVGQGEEKKEFGFAVMRGPQRRFEILLEGKPVFSVQHHPEASPGPQDSHYLFTRFCNLMRAQR